MTSGGSVAANSVAEFYQKMMAALESLKMPVTIWTTPVEVPDRVPFEDQKHAAYDPEYAQRCWRILVQSNRILTKFRSRFTGKVSPVMHCKHNIHMPEGSDFGMESWLAILYNNLDML